MNLLSQERKGDFRDFFVINTFKDIANRAAVLSVDCAQLKEGKRRSCACCHMNKIII